MIQGKLFRTDDIWVASFLLCMGREVESTELVSRRVWLSFKVDGDLEGELVDYQREGLVEARKLFAAVASVRRLLDGFSSLRKREVKNDSFRGPAEFSVRPGGRPARGGRAASRLWTSGKRRDSPGG